MEVTLSAKAVMEAARKIHELPEIPADKLEVRFKVVGGDEHGYVMEVILVYK